MNRQQRRAWTDAEAIDAVIEAVDKIAGWSKTKPSLASLIGEKDAITLVGGAPRSSPIETVQRVGAEEAADALHSLAIIVLGLLDVVEPEDGGGSEQR
jgi:hypothetical protein